MTLLAPKADALACKLIRCPAERFVFSGFVHEHLSSVSSDRIEVGMS